MSSNKTPRDRDAFIAESLAHQVAQEAQGVKEVRISLDSGAIVNLRTVLGYILLVGCVSCSLVQTILLIWGFLGAPMGVGYLLAPLWVFLIMSGVFLGFWTLTLWVTRATKRLEERLK